MVREKEKREGRRKGARKIRKVIRKLKDGKTMEMDGIPKMEVWERGFREMEDI